MKKKYIFDYKFDTSNPLAIDGETLDIESLVMVARNRRRVYISESAVLKINKCRAMVDVLLKNGEKVYGLTTGFGKLRDVYIDSAHTITLQKNLIRSHACGIGAPFDEDVVRAAILLRINTLCKGFSGIRLEVVLRLVDLLNDDIYPFIPSKGSVGASGDLAPLSHLGLLLMGDPCGKYYPKKMRANDKDIVKNPSSDLFVSLPEGFNGSYNDSNDRNNTSNDFDTSNQNSKLESVYKDENWTFRPIELREKEGLAINNGTQFMTAISALAVYDSYYVLRYSELSSAMSLEAQRGIRNAYQDEIHLARPHDYQLDVAKRIMSYCEGSQILDLYLNSARVYRAEKIHLKESIEWLEQIKNNLSTTESKTAFNVVSSEVSSLLKDIENIFPKLDSTKLDFEYLKKHSSAPPREQIRYFQELLSPIRQQLANLLKTDLFRLLAIDNANSYSLISKLQSTFVDALKQLDSSVPTAPLVQDDYSLRCYPQVLACAYRALWHVRDIVEIEMNSATDNPLLFPPTAPSDIDNNIAKYEKWLEEDPLRVELCRKNTLGGGNFHGEPIAIAMDYLTIAMAEVGNISERRIAHLVDEHVSGGLPPFLIDSSGLNSGFMIPQYTAAALVSENKVLSHPASVDSIPTCANSEDHVSMGTIAARKSAIVIEHIAYIIGIELLAAYQGLKFRLPLEPGFTIRAVIKAIKDSGISHYGEDRVMYVDINHIKELMKKEELLILLKKDSA